MLGWRSHPLRVSTGSSSSSSSSSSGSSSSSSCSRLLRPCLTLQHGARASSRATVKCQAAAKCLYTLLGVEATASADEIKIAYRKLALRLHPDVNPAPDAAEAFKTAKEAYEVLSDPQQRQQYNQQRTRQARSRMHSSYSASSSASSSQGASSRGRYRPAYDDIIYEYMSAEAVFSEDEADPADMPGFYGWYSKSGSWQSSEQANRKKQRARQEQQQQQQQQQQQWRRQQDAAAVEALLSQLDRETRGIIAQVLGQQLERMDSLEELMELIAALEVLRAQGIRPDPHMYRAKVGSAGDYVTYSSSVDDDSDDEDSSDGPDVLEEVGGWIDLDDLIERADAAYWVEFDSDDDD
ncbi:hypothetical protein OEZ86_000801 [Tetradesmus obliquus]|nr:hypothetical protein OEZ86_000801 [Tetradesmus obliquus]